MITALNERVFEFRGLLKDLEARDFPVTYSIIAQGSTFHAMDEDQLYIYDKEHDEWVEYSGSGGGGVKVNKDGAVTGLVKTIKVGNKIYAIQGTTQTGMIEYFYNPKKANEPFLTTKIGEYTTILQKSVIPASSFDLFEQIFDEHGTVAYVTSVDNAAGTVTVRTMTTGASVNDDIITKETIGGIPAGTNLKGMSPTDLVVALTAPTKINEVSTNVGGSITGPTSLNIGEKLKITSVTPNFDAGGQGDITYVKVEAKENGGTAKVLYETPASQAGVSYASGTKITLDTTYTLSGSVDTDIIVTLTTQGNESVNPATKVETISFIYDGRDYYAVNSNESAAPNKKNWITLNGSEYEITVKENEVIWFMLTDKTRVLQQYAMGTWANSDWYLITYDSANKVYKYNTGALYAGTYKFRLV